MNSSLAYGSESWTLIDRHKNKIEEILLRNEISEKNRQQNKKRQNMKYDNQESTKWDSNKHNYRRKAIELLRPHTQSGRRKDDKKIFRDKSSGKNKRGHPRKRWVFCSHERRIRFDLEI